MTAPVRRVSVTVDDAHVDAIAAVAEALRGRGMRVDEVLDAVGVITGSVPESDVRSLPAVDGVASVDDAVDVRLPPPDSPVQ